MKMQAVQLLLLVLSLATVTDAGDGEYPSTDFLYFDQDENEPVIEFFPAMSDKPRRGDFRLSSKPKMVEFYNPYCGACQAYKPTYLKLSKDLMEEAGEEKMEIYAVSCQVHQALCNLYNIDSIPTVALFREGEEHASVMRKLQVNEKHPDFIIPYLFPDRSVNEFVKRDLTEEGEGGESGEGEENEEKESEEERESEEEKEGDESEEENGKGSEEGDKESEDGEEHDNGSESGEGETPDGSEEEEGNESKEDDKESGEEPADSEEEKPAEDDDENATNEKDLEEANQMFFEESNNKHGIGNWQGDRIRAGDIPKSVTAGAGAMMSKEMAADMDRFQEALKKHHNDNKSVFFRQDPLGIQNKKVKEAQFDNTSGATKAMRAHEPGTEEYNIRQKKIKDHMAVVLKNKHLRTTVPAPQTRFSAGAGGASRFQVELPKNHKPVVSYKKEIKPKKLVHSVAGKLPLIKRFVVLSHEEELILDTSLSLMTVLRTGLFTNTEPLGKSKKRAFQGWLDLLRVSLPPEWGIHELIFDLDDNIDYISQDSSKLNHFLSRHELPRKEWSHSCTSDGAQNGFNCGFWKLLHVISVGVAEHRGGLNLVEDGLVSKDARVFSPSEAADAMKEFIRDFFPCTECSNHFVAQYDECSNRRCVRLTDEGSYASAADWQELSKWLWEVHNDVSVRLMRERSSKKELTIHDDLKVLYPSLKECVSCFREDGGFDEDGVFLFLEKEYWPGASDIDPAADKLIYFHNAEYEGFASAWALLFLGVGIIYMCRPRGVFPKRAKKRAD